MTISLRRVGIFALFSVVEFSSISSNALAAGRLVRCNIGQTIQKALNTALDGDELIVSGACSENIILEKNRITLRGTGGATLNGPSNEVATIVIRGQNNRILDFSSISGGRQVIQIERGGSAEIVNNVIESGQRGILVSQSAYALVQGNIIRSNGVNGGVTVRQSAAADIASNTISGNTGVGISVDDGASADIEDNEITGNRSEGIRVRGTSHARFSLSPNLRLANLIEGNNGGIICSFNSSIRSGVAQNFGMGNNGLNTSTPAASCSLNGPLE